MKKIKELESVVGECRQAELVACVLGCRKVELAGWSGTLDVYLIPLT
jgi:hypothetical protein